MLKAIFWDMDGCITDTQKYHVRAWFEVFTEYGQNIERLEFALLEGMSYSETIDLICKKHNIFLTIDLKENIAKRREEIFNKIFKLTFFNVKKKLLKLKEKGIKLALVSGSNRETISKVLKNEFSGIFDFVVSGDDVKHGKPSIEPYKKAYDFFGFKKRECLVIENAPLGISSAKNFGLQVFALQTTLPKKYLEKSDKIFKNHNVLFKEIFKLLD